MGALGVDDDDAVRVRGPERGHVLDGWNRWWTEQWPFQSRNVVAFRSASDRPPISSRGFQTRMSSSE